MFAKVYEFAKSLILYVDELKQARRDIDSLQDDMRNIMLAVERLTYQMEYLQKRQMDHEKNTQLQMENDLLKFEKRLPSSPDK